MITNNLKFFKGGGLPLASIGVKLYADLRYPLFVAIRHFITVVFSVFNKLLLSRRYLLVLFSLAILSLTVSITTISADEVYSKNKKGNDYYKKEKFDDALKEYDDALLIAPADTLLKMNRGSSLYRLGRFQEADSAYTGTLSLSSRRKRADAHYNLGNIQFKEGDMLMQSGGEGAGEKFKSALQNYITALDLRPDDKDAKWNIELTQRKIKQQEQQQKNQRNKNNQNDKNKKDQDKQNPNKDKQNKNQNQKNKDKKDQNKQDQQNQNAKNDKQQQQPPQPQPQDKKEDMKKKEAERIVAQFADDADTLNKPPKKKGLGLMMRKPEKDW